MLKYALVLQKFRSWTQDSSDLVMPRPRPHVQPASHTRAAKSATVLLGPPSMLFGSMGHAADQLQELFADAGTKTIAGGADGGDSSLSCCHCYCCLACSAVFFDSNNVDVNDVFKA